MNTFGIEWDTNLCILDDGTLNSKEIFFQNKENLLTITTETHNELQCLMTLEAQLGVFKDIKTFKEKCNAFIEWWNNIITNKKIKNHKLYVLRSSKKELFSTCTPNIFENRGFTHAGNLDSYTLGKVQFTGGFDLKKVISIFAYISELYSKYSDMYPKPTEEEKIPDLLYYYIYNSIFDITHFCKLQNILSNHNLFSFYLLAYYYLSITHLILLNPFPQNKYIAKDFFMLKLRTNLSHIYRFVNSPDIQPFITFYKKINEKYNENIIYHFETNINSPYFIPYWSSNYNEFGEWDMQNNTVHIEFRTTGYLLYYESINSKIDKTLQFLYQNSTTNSKNLCPYISTFLTKIIKPILEINIENLLIPKV